MIERGELFTRRNDVEASSTLVMKPFTPWRHRTSEVPRAQAPRAHLDLKYFFHNKCYDVHEYSRFYYMQCENQFETGYYRRLLETRTCTYRR